MPFRAVLDSDGLIKLAKAGLLEPVVKAWNCLVPEAVYVETVERGIEAAFPDALMIRQVLPPAAVQPAVRHPRAAALLERTRGLGQGERDTLHLFFAARADVIITDDAAFVSLLERAGLRDADRPGGDAMKTIYALYEDGVLKPLEKLDLKESQRLKLTLEVLPSIVEETQALIRAKADVVKEVAEREEYLPEGSAT